MTSIFQDMIGKCVTVYIDDIQIFSPTFSQHIAQLREVLQRLRNEGFYLKPKKCTIAAHEMKYLGFLVKQEGLAMDPSKIQAVKTYLIPKNVTEL